MFPILVKLDEMHGNQEKIFEIVCRYIDKIFSQMEGADR